MKGQTVIEYIMLIGIVTVVLVAMSVTIRRGTQGVIKGMADQLATQQNAEQDFSFDQSYMEGSRTQVSANNRRNVSQLNYRTEVIADENARTQASVTTNMGFTPDSPP